MAELLLIQEAYATLAGPYKAEAELVLCSTGFIELLKKTIANCTECLGELDYEDKDELQNHYRRIQRERSMYIDLLELSNHCISQRDLNQGDEQ